MHSTREPVSVHLEAASRSRSTDVAQRQDTRKDAGSKCAETQALAEPAVGLGLVCERVWCVVGDRTLVLALSIKKKKQEQKARIRMPFWRRVLPTRSRSNFAPTLTSLLNTSYGEEGPGPLDFGITNEESRVRNLCSEANANGSKSISAVEPLAKLDNY